MEKIKSLLVEKGEEPDTKAKYEEIYSDAKAWLYEKSHGVHSVILTVLHEKLKGAHHLDVGCGAGRLALMSAHLADEVTAFDFSEKAISLCRRHLACVNVSNVRFLRSSIEEFCQMCEDKYEVITMVGVLEHVQNPAAVLLSLSSLLAKDGVLVVSCPGFINFRGFTYMTLLNLFDLPMSLADLHQITPNDMKKWAQAAGMKVRGTIGALYKFAWGERSARDMMRRVPLAIRDKGLPIDVNYRKYDTWLEEMASYNKLLLEWLDRHNILKKITKPVEMKLERPNEMAQEIWEKAKSYLNENVSSDPFYCDQEPFCYFGGEGIYVLERIKG